MPFCYATRTDRLCALLWLRRPTENALFYAQNQQPFVMGTTGGDREKLVEDVKVAGVYAVIAPNMGKQVGENRAKRGQAAGGEGVRARAGGEGCLARPEKRVKIYVCFEKASTSFNLTRARSGVIILLGKHPTHPAPSTHTQSPAHPPPSFLWCCRLWPSRR
jgi:hypothetical protein